MMCPLLGDVEEREKEDPDDVHKVPVDAGEFYPLEFPLFGRSRRDEAHDHRTGDDVGRVKAGGRVDRIELGACEGGGERRPGAWRMAEGKAEGKARDQDQADETTEAAAAEAKQEQEKDGVPWRTWATAMKNGDEEKDEL